MNQPSIIDIVLLSLQVGLVATMLVAPAAIFVAWLFARGRLPMQAFWEALVNAPIVIPPVAVGLALIYLLAENGPIGRLWAAFGGGPLLLTWLGAVAASATVGFPLFVKASQQAFAEVPKELELMAASFGVSSPQIFRMVTLRLSARGVVYGAMLCFLRGIGEFGATTLVAGNIPGKTQTVALAIYAAIISGDDSRAWLLSSIALGIALLVSLIPLFLIRPLGRER